MKRCSWVNENNQEYIEYHDTQWGVAVHDDRVLFEMLVLEWAQAGLSWETILKKRNSYREAFDFFDVQKIIDYDENKIERLLQNEGIIRNRLKVLSVIQNAKVFIEIQKEFWSFDSYVWSYVGFTPMKNSFQRIDEVPVQTEISQVLSKDLKKRWMSFVGPTIIYAYMQAIGMVVDHTTDCFRYNQL